MCVCVFPHKCNSDGQSNPDALVSWVEIVPMKNVLF